MSVDNPYQAPRAPIEPQDRRPPSPLGPIAAGLVAIILATFLMGAIGLLASVLGVGSWWVRKFWPRPTVPEDEGARAFLERLEATPRIVGTASEASRPQPSESEGDLFKNLRL